VTIFAAALVLLAFGYSGLMGAFALGFRRLVRDETPETGGAEAVSVVIAARNEADNIEACLNSVLACGPVVAEVIVVDDHSDDGTCAIVRRVAGRHVEGSSVRLLRLNGTDGSGKAHAIRKGVEHASCERILTTDADCVVHPGWARAMGRCLRGDVLFVAGPVRFAPLQDVRDRVQALEFLGLVAVGAGAIGAGWPNMCNSANIGYRRDVFLSWRPQGGGLVPEDEVMLQRLHKRDPRSVRFCVRKEAMVCTPPAQSIASFVSQRRRWAGTGARYPSKALVMMIAAVYLFYFAVAAAAVLAVWSTTVLWALCIALALKIVAEASLLRRAVRQFEVPGLMPLFLPAQLVQIPYVILIGLTGLIGEVTWKDRPVVS
jgi:poly-beta-1,6-N-acetyl-D-glucosamine synthase